MVFQVPKGLQADRQLSDSQFSFKGAWQPDYDPAKIGPENFKLLQNLRYVDGGLEGVLGYTEINTTPLTTYTKIWNGFHLRSNRTQATYVLVHAVDPATGQGRVYENRTAIASQGDFEGTQLHADASVNLLGRFSGTPGGGVAYCNGEENYIYNGDEMRVAGFFRCTNTSLDDPEDFTDEINNTLTDSDEIVELEVGTKPFWLIFTTRPITEVTYAIETANSSGGGSTMSGYYFDGTDFSSSLSNLSDGTATGGDSMAQSGTVTFDAQSDAAPYHFQGLYLYCYKFTISDGTGCDVSYVTVKAPWQSMVDVWDGVYRQPIQCQLDNNSTGGLEDYTLQVNESSDIQVPIGCQLDQMTSSDTLEVMFEERMSAIRIVMLGDLLNVAASEITVKYWNGDAYAAVTGQVDGTLDSGGTKSFNRSGLISWAPPDRSSERKQTKYGTTGYMYQITVDGTLTGTEGGSAEVMIDVITGIPAQLKIRPFKFSVLYKGRLMRGNYVAGKEGNRLDFTSKDAADVWNGFDSSMDGIQGLFFGGQDDLTNGIQLYNRFGSQIYAVLLVVKPTETYILNGDSPEDYKIYPVSQKVGCPAPLTLDSAEVGFNLAEDIERNVAIWCSYAGPVMFDGAVLKPIRGIDIYFDPNSDNPVNTDAIENARGWVDSTYQEYNLLLPVGSSQTTCNKWFVYDLRRKKWYEKELATADKVQCGIPVYDTYGVQYIYGGTLVGSMMHLENSASWNGINIDQKVQTGDFWPSENIWHQTRIRYLMLVAERVDEDVDVAVYHFADTDVTGTDQVSFTDLSGEVSWADTTAVEWAETSSISVNLQSSGNSKRLARDSGPMNKLAWAHGFSFELSSSSVARGFKPIAWAIRWEYERHDRTR